MTFRTRTSRRRKQESIQEASLRAQLSATESLIELNERSLGVLRAQKSYGYATQLDVVAQEAQLAQARATLPPLQKQLELERGLLATLSGNYAADGSYLIRRASNTAAPRSRPFRTLPMRW